MGMTRHHDRLAVVSACHALLTCLLLGCLVACPPRVGVCLQSVACEQGFCCARVVSLDCTLAEQLEALYGGGFELHTWSNLPQGSGLGTSSILAGAVMAVLWKCIGKERIGGVD